MHTISIAVVVAGLAILLYIIALYPLLLAVMASRERPIRKEWIPKTVSVIIPTHNGSRYVRAKLQSLLELDYPRSLLEILLVSDGSTDDTEQIAEAFAKDGIRLMRIPKGGKAAALNAAIPATTGEILLLTDVRQPVAPDCLRRLVCCFADPSVGAVSGHLLIRKALNQEQEDIGVYWRYETWIRDNLAKVDSIFGATGPLYAIRRNLIVPIPPEILLDDMYLPLAGFFKGYRLIVEPAAKAFDIPTPRRVEFRRKVRTLAGNYQLLRYYPQLLGPGNRMWLHFLSYKVGRLTLPYLLVAVLLASFGLPGGWREFMLLAQVAFYLIAGLDPWIPNGTLPKRVSSPARTFLTMMAATLCGLAVFFVPPQKLWKVTDVPVQPVQPVQSDTLPL